MEDLSLHFCAWMITVLAFHHNKYPHDACLVKRETKIIANHLQKCLPPSSSLPAHLFMTMAFLNQKENGYLKNPLLILLWTYPLPH